MQAHNDQAQPLTHMNSTDIGTGGGRKSVVEFVRRWGPCVFTAIVLPGGIFIAMVMVFRHWKQRRQMLASPAQA